MVEIRRIDDHNPLNELLLCIDDDGMICEREREANISPGWIVVRESTWNIEHVDSIFEESLVLVLQQHPDS